MGIFRSILPLFALTVRSRGFSQIFARTFPEYFPLCLCLALWIIAVLPSIPPSMFRAFPSAFSAALLGTFSSVRAPPSLLLYFLEPERFFSHSCLGNDLDRSPDHSPAGHSPECSPGKSLCPSQRHSSKVGGSSRLFGGGPEHFV